MFTIALSWNGSENKKCPRCGNLIRIVEDYPIGQQLQYHGKSDFISGKPFPKLHNDWHKNKLAILIAKFGGEGQVIHRECVEQGETWMPAEIISAISSK